jgi:hypothetical protein
MAPSSRWVTPGNLKKVASSLPRVATGTVALAVMYMYVYGWDENEQIIQAKRDAVAETKK